VRYFIRKILRILRRRGYNHRFALIAGTGELAQKLLRQIEFYPELGIRVIGFLTRKVEEVGKEIKNIPILGVYEELDTILETNLALFESVDNGTTWIKKGGTVDIANNNISLVGVNSFALWSLNDKDYPTSIEGESIQPKEFSLKQNYPNPFNPSTVIKYQLAENSFVTLKVFDVLGEEVTTLVNEFQNAGLYSINFRAERVYISSLTSGIYFYRLNAGSPSTSSGQVFVQTKKMILIK